MEQRVADYIIKHSHRVPFESVSHIANSVNVSVPSVTRLTKRLGYKNFKDFKVELAVNGAQSPSVTDVFSQIEKDDSDFEMIEKIFLGNARSLEDTMRILDKQMISDFSRLCANTSRLLFIGQGGSGLVCDEAALRFGHLDIQAEAYSDTVGILLQSTRLKKGQICVGVSHSGRTSLVEEGLRIAKENQAVTALITNYMNTPIKDCCDYVFYTSFIENTVKAAAVSSKIAQIAIVDAIYLLTAKKKRNLWDLGEFDNKLKHILWSK